MWPHTHTHSYCYINRPLLAGTETAALLNEYRSVQTGSANRLPGAAMARPAGGLACNNNIESSPLRAWKAEITFIHANYKRSSSEAQTKRYVRVAINATCCRPRSTNDRCDKLATVKTSLCSASALGCKHGTARIRCWAPGCRSPVACVRAVPLLQQRDRQTDTMPLHRTFSARGSVSKLTTLATVDASWTAVRNLGLYVCIQHEREEHTDRNGYYWLR